MKAGEKKYKERQERDGAGLDRNRHEHIFHFPIIRFPQVANVFRLHTHTDTLALRFAATWKQMQTQAHMQKHKQYGRHNSSAHACWEKRKFHKEQVGVTIAIRMTLIPLCLSVTTAKMLPINPDRLQSVKCHLCPDVMPPPNQSTFNYFLKLN